jgi:hypothetical protein
MANEITYQLQALLNNLGLTDNFSSGSIAVSQIQRLMVKNVQYITSVAPGEALDLGDVTTPGFTIFKNLDPTNFVLIGKLVTGNFEDLLKVNPGEVQLCRLSTAPYALADTAPVSLLYVIYSD